MQNMLPQGFVPIEPNVVPLSLRPSPETLARYDLIAPTYSLNKQSGFLHGAMRWITGEPLPYILCLGWPIPVAVLPDPEPTYKLSDFSKPCPDYLHPGLVDIARLLFLAPTDRRMAYRWLLEMRIKEAEPESDRHTILYHERNWWEIYDDVEMRDRLTQLAEPLHMLRANTKKHWMWNLALGERFPTDHPALSSWHGQKKARIYRMLWATERSQDPFEIGSRPQRTDMCSEKLCVNPWHFVDVSGQPLARATSQGLGRGKRGVVRTASNLHVTPDNLRWNGTAWIAYCPNLDCGAELSPDIQTYFNTPDPFTRELPVEKHGVYCRACYVRHKLFYDADRRRNPRVRGATEANDQESIDIEQDVLREFYANKHLYEDKPEDTA